MSKTKNQFNHSTTDTEKAMERKIILLEQRLRLVEQFVELRFCESFKDFTIRKMLRDLPPEDYDDQDDYDSSEDQYSHAPSKSKPPPPSSSTQKTPGSTRTSNRITAQRPPNSSKDTTTITSTPTTERELRVRVLRVNGTQPQTNQSSTSSPPPTPSKPTPSQPLIKIPPPDSDDDFEPDDNFTDFNPEDNPPDSDPDYMEDEDTSSPPPLPKRRSGAAGPLSSKKKRKTSSGGGSKRVIPANRKECPECHGFWKPEALEKHLLTHSKERNLPCRFCDKRFIEKKHLVEHEKSHNLAKYGKKCRVEGCGQLCIDRSKQLVHERRCIKKKLGQGGFVDVEVLEDVRRRSQNVDLGWPEEEEGIEGTQEITENNEEQMQGTEFVNSVEGDPLEGNFDNF